MSEYQRYEFMTCDRPLTSQQLAAVNNLSSHITASATHAVIEYNYGDFKHNPIKVLHQYFDGFLYWANWGSPQLAFRFPHGTLAADLIDGYDLYDFATFTQHRDFDILDMQFGEMEGSGGWADYNLTSLIAIREELLDGDLRALYITWLAAQAMRGSYEIEEEEEDVESVVPPVPPGFAKLTSAQRALAALWDVSDELLAAAASHSKVARASSTSDNFAAWIKLLPPDRSNSYLLRLANNETGLSRLLMKELRTLGKDKTEATPPPSGERVTYGTLIAESNAAKAQLEREKLEKERLARLQHLQTIHDHQNTYWQQVDKCMLRSSGSGYEDAVSTLIELRDAAKQFNETTQFQGQFAAWVRPHLRRSAFLKRLYTHGFPLPDM